MIKKTILGLFIIVMMLCAWAPAPRPFEDFFAKFNTDPDYQKEHVIFPLLYVGHDDYGEFKTVYINKDKWNHLSYNVDSLVFEIKSEGPFANACIIQYPDTDTEYRLVFRCIDNEWYLSDFLDYSLYL